MNSDKCIAIGSDHAGFKLKEILKTELEHGGFAVDDMGTTGLEAVDYPVYAAKVARAVSTGAVPRGVVICGSGIGSSMTANRFPHVRAALCITDEMARLSRQHNDANMLILGERLTSPDVAIQILKAWLFTAFEGGRHEKRVALIDLEGQNHA